VWRVETDTPGGGGPGGWICLSVTGMYVTVGWDTGWWCHEQTFRGKMDPWPGKNGFLPNPFGPWECREQEDGWWYNQTSLYLSSDTCTMEDKIQSLPQELRTQYMCHVYSETTVTNGGCVFPTRWVVPRVCACDPVVISSSSPVFYSHSKQISVPPLWRCPISRLMKRRTADHVV
jgi:hypothetical protein